MKISVIGCGGAGKSSLARRLSEDLNLPLIHLDTYFWNPGWIETPESLWREKVEDLVAEPKWIMDGNFSGTFDLRFPASDSGCGGL